MKKSTFFASAVFSSLLLISCTSSTIVSNQSAISRKIDQMTLREKVGQLFVVRPESLDPSYTLEQIHKGSEKGSLEISMEMTESYKKYPAGGIILFARNIQTPVQIKKFTNQIHHLPGLTPFVYVDEEGGLVSRLANNSDFYLPEYKDMRTIGDTKNSAEAKNAGLTIGRYLKKYGFDVDFAPVADIDTNPKNPIIGRRAFSSDAKVVAEMAVAFEKGLKLAGIQGCYKHFPGHGDTQTDTHYGYAEVRKNWQQLQDCEIEPFKAAIENGAGYIMTAHITAPKVDPSNVPSTMSKIILTDKLRGELGYQGIIITDGMEMGAITKQYKPGDAAIQAILAGVDIILIPYDYTNTFDAVVKVVEDGLISEERLNQSLSRILTAKGF